MQKLLSYIDNPNIAEMLDEEELEEIGKKVCEDYSKDRDSMSSWSEAVEKGMKVAEPAKGSKSFPWDGASNYKSPMIYEAVIAFGDRASSEILTEKNLVRGCITGADTPDKQMRMTRVAKFMNWQFNYEMKEWRDEQEQALYALASVGVFFKKTFFDPTEGKNTSVPIFYPNFAVNQNERSMSAMTRFTECKNYSDNEIKERISAGIWLDIEMDKEDEDDNEDGDESEEVEVTDDFLEQCTAIDLDEDGYAEPYIVTVHKPTGKVVRIVARFDKSSILVKVGEGVVAPLSQVEQQAIASVATEELKNVAAMTPEEADAVDQEKFVDKLKAKAYKGMTIVKIKPVGLITKYGFVVAPDGTFLNWGYCHLLAGACELINTTTNQLIDSGTLANLQGGWKSKEFRQNKKPMVVKPGEYTQLDVDAEVLKNGILPHIFKEPSPALMQMNETAKAEARNMSAVIQMEGMIAPNAPAATTLGILQEKMMPTSTLIGRVLRSMSEEFSKMFDLNAKYTDPQVYLQVLDDPQADYAQDFTRQGYDIEPVADATKSSQMQKMQTVSVLIEIAPLFDNPTPANIAIATKSLQAIGEDELAMQLSQQQPPQTDPQLLQMEQQRLQMEQMNAQLQQQNNELLKQQHEIKIAMLQLEQQKLEQKAIELELKAAELELKAKDQSDKIALEAVKLDAEAQRIEADENLKVAQTFKTYQEAEQIGAPKVDVTIGAIPDGMQRQ